jgi:hypothetical protein
MGRRSDDRVGARRIRWETVRCIIRHWIDLIGSHRQSSIAHQGRRGETKLGTLLLLRRRDSELVLSVRRVSHVCVRMEGLGVELLLARRLVGPRPNRSFDEDLCCKYECQR